MDTKLAIITNLAMGTGLAFAVASLARRLSNSTMNALSGVCVLLMLSHVLASRETLLLANILPSETLMFLGNPFPLLIGCFIGLAWWGLTSMPRKLIVTAGLGTFGILSLIYPLLGSPPACSNTWADEICLQSTDSTCSAAAAATLLKRFDIDSTEQEMAELCLTRRGTTWGGLVRGLALKLNDEPLAVRASHLTLEELTALGRPAILKVGLESHDERAASLRRGGWRVGQAHSVVFLGLTSGNRVRIADPSTGLEYWSIDDLLALWHGQTTWVEPKN